MRGYPATVNSVREAAFAAAVGERIFGKGNVITDPTPTMGGEGIFLTPSAGGRRARGPVWAAGGRARRLLPAPSELRFQRRGDPARRGLPGGARRRSFAT